MKTYTPLDPATNFTTRVLLLKWFHLGKTHLIQGDSLYHFLNTNTETLKIAYQLQIA